MFKTLNFNNVIIFTRLYRNYNQNNYFLPISTIYIIHFIDLRACVVDIYYDFLDMYTYYNLFRQSVNETINFIYIVTNS